MISIILAVAVLGVIVLRRFNRVLGSVLAILLASGIGIWGFLIYRDGGQIAFAGQALPAAVFAGIIGVWVVLEGISLTQALRVRKDSGELDDDAG